MCLFGAAHGWGGGKNVFPFLKCAHSYPTMMKLGKIIPYLKKIQKIYEHMTYTLISAGITIFFTGNQQNLLYQEIQI